jgi:hypothetical protein
MTHSPHFDVQAKLWAIATNQKDSNIFKSTENFINQSEELNSDRNNMVEVFQVRQDINNLSAFSKHDKESSQILNYGGKQTKSK